MNMKNNKITLISLIGKGRTIGDTKGYDKADYFFSETKDIYSTSFFGSALFKDLLKRGYEVGKWLIFGTDRSNWSELLGAIDENYHNELVEAYDRIYDEENKGISKELVSQWENTLQQYIPAIRLIKVDPLDYEIYINHMIKEIPDEKTGIVLDITHALRHMPVIIAFSLMTLKYVKDISDITVYYGAFDLGNKDSGIPVPVLEIDIINTLVTFTENLAIYNNSANFIGVMDNLGVKDTDDTYFWLEMNRQPRKWLKEISQKLSEISLEENYKGSIARYMKKEIDPLIGTTLHERMVERAILFFDKKQYLKALILLYEGIILMIGQKYGYGSDLGYENRNEIRNFIKENKGTIFQNAEQHDTYYNLEYTRNAAAHGSRAIYTQDYVEQISSFKSLFEKGVRLYEEIKKSI